MSEVRSRPSAVRGRGSGRGSRGGYNSRGGRLSTRQTNGDMPDSTPSSSLEEEGELGELKRMYSSKLLTIKEMFPNYTDEDIVFALQETDGNLEATIDRISEGKSTTSVPYLAPLILHLSGQVTFRNGVK